MHHRELSLTSSSAPNLVDVISKNVKHTCSIPTYSRTLIPAARLSNNTVQAQKRQAGQLSKCQADKSTRERNGGGRAIRDIHPLVRFVFWLGP